MDKFIDKSMQILKPNLDAKIQNPARNLDSSDEFAMNLDQNLTKNLVCDEKSDKNSDNKDKFADEISAKTEEIQDRFTRSRALFGLNFTKLQTEIVKRIPSNYTMTSTRRFMLRIAEEVAYKEGCLAIATGESLGQVASQTLESMNCINEVTNLPVLRPLLTMDKVDIIKIAQDIDTLEISNLPFEDCCTIFTPKAPKTRPRLEKIKSYEARDDYSELIEETLVSVKTYLFDKNGQVITKDISEDKVFKEDFSDLL